MKTFSGKTAIVTGATKGIGLAISLALIEKGVFAYLVGRDFNLLNSHLEKYEGQNKASQPIRADLSVDADLEKIADMVSGTGIDILIHSAGVISIVNFEHLSVVDLDRQYSVNVRAPFTLTRMLLPSLREKKGQVIFINSTSGLESWGKVSQYSATKHALKALVNSLRKELSGEKVRVMNIYPGSVDTPMQRYIQQSLGNMEYKPGQYMKPEDIAGLVIALLSLPETVSVTDITVKPNT